MPAGERPGGVTAGPPQSDGERDEGSGMTVDDLIGEWECFAGSGIHGWNEQRRTFWRDAGNLFVRIEIPASTGREPEVGRTFGPYRIRSCEATASGLDLRVVGDGGDEWLWSILSRRGGKFTLVFVGTTAGTSRYRRVRGEGTRLE